MLLYGEKGGRRGTYRVQGKEVGVAIVEQSPGRRIMAGFQVYKRV